jgi:HEAT repeat protein
MFRSSRSIALLVRSLMLGTAATVLTGALVTTTIGCKDESQPEYWVEKLEDPAWRPRAIKRLEQFFEDTVTKANKDMQNAEVQALLNKTAEPLTKSYVEKYSEYDGKTRVSLIKLLASFRDKRTEPALKKAFEEFAKKPTGSKDDADIKWAARAAADLKLESLGEPLVQAFMKMKTHTMLGGIAYRDMNEAMLAMPQKSWSEPLKGMLEAKIERPEGPKDKDKVDPYKDQLFWQTTSAEVLGVLRDESAVEPLMKALLDPSKADVAATALLALVKIGKPAVDRAVKLLKDQDKALADFCLLRTKEATKAKEPPKDKPYVATAAIILGTTGRSEAVPPMIAALKSAANDMNRAVIARELTKLPATADSKQAFREAFEQISIESSVPPGLNALTMLAETSGQFYDASMINWLLERADKTKGGGEDLKALQAAIAVTILKIAKPDQMASVKAGVDKYGTKMEKDLYAQVDKLVKACGDRAQCYLAEIEKGENQDQKNQFAGIKAAYMLAILGNEQTRDEIIARLDTIENAAVRFTAAAAIDSLSPKGSKEAADKLNRIIQKNKETGDQNKIQGDAPLKQVMYRLETRAT